MIETTRQPRMYSINLAAYLLLTTELYPEFGDDEETDSIYFVFPEVAAIKIAITEFRYGKPLVKLDEYLAAIRRIRNSMRDRKEGKLNE